KIFIIHSLFIIILFFILFLSMLNKFKYSFRVQLLISFFVISVIPVLILAAYNRQVVEDRSRSALFNELNERIDYVEKHVEAQLVKYKDRNLSTAFVNAGKELGIAFGVYSSSNLIYNTNQQYYNIGLFPEKLDPNAHYQLNYLSYREFLTEEKVENYNYSAFYKKIHLNGEDLIIGVNEAFNKVKITFSLIDVDVFLFGIYSFAIILILIISTILANKISSPIRKLTKATAAVGHGDFNVELVNKERGELRDLISGFNSMTRELQHNQSELAAMERESAWKEMAKQVAHEIKNPLTPMKLAVQQLMAAYRDKSKNFDLMFEKLTATLLNQVDSLSTIASEFSRFAKMPSIKLEQVDIVSAAQDTINLFTDEKVTISLNSVVEQAMIEADNAQLRRMFINMIRNAIQANADKITITIKKAEDKFEILVTDNGNGINNADKEKIFETNFTTKAKGMGIGLKLTKRFLEGINSSIALVESSPGGTTFKIEIPSSDKGNS
ncbi:MAG: HAMP domain-containing protein, partial [Ignavibacteriaceae bacterium]|nr:HAMP domain-containing protein [Ignavibacteriaceae bacterium]